LAEQLRLLGLLLLSWYFDAPILGWRRHGLRSLRVYSLSGSRSLLGYGQALRYIQKGSLLVYALLIWWDLCWRRRLLIGDRRGGGLENIGSPRGAVGVGTRNRREIIAVGAAEILLGASTVAANGNEDLWHDIAGFGGAGVILDGRMGVAAAEGVDLSDTHDVTGLYGVVNSVVIQR
jgi:hypothetical protein